MLAIKLQRIGKKHQPSYRVVVAEKRSKLVGPPVEDLGSYSPASKNVHVNKDRAQYWLKIGAQPTVTVHNLLITSGVIQGKKTSVKMKKPEPKAQTAEAAAPAEPATPAAEAPAEVVPEATSQSVEATESAGE